MDARISTAASSDPDARTPNGAPAVLGAETILRGRGLEAHLQPVVSLRDGMVMAHEALVRGPVGHPLRTPLALLAVARDLQLTAVFEEAAFMTCLQAWVQAEASGHVTINLSANVLSQIVDRICTDVTSLPALEGSPLAGTLVIEITEHERVDDMAALLQAAERLRSLGVRFALDDFGDGRSSLRLWSELRPEYVKIDSYFVRGVHSDAIKVQTLRGLMRFAELFGTRLIAEGVEQEGELRAVRDLGIEFAQGYLLGKPGPRPRKRVDVAVMDIIRSKVIAVLPEPTHAGGSDFTVGRIAERVPPVGPEMTVDELAALFASDDSLRAVAVVDGTRTVGLVSRQRFVDRYARPFFKEVHGRRPCLSVANTAPLQLDRNTGVAGAAELLTSNDQRYLTEGFVVTDAGPYCGLGTGQQLVRVVTEARIEAARHANPLTFLPGNIPITQHIERLLEKGSVFAAWHGDLNDFKPFNDHYGYWRGDEMIRLAARCFVEHCDPRRDFVGHVGGDDFVILFQSEDWLERCEQIVTDFNRLAIDLFDATARERGGIEAEDRYGVRRFFRFTTLSIGAVAVPANQVATPSQVASSAASAKSRAKHAGLRICVDQGLSDPPETTPASLDPLPVG